jgi:Ca2+-binding RTX toxin-like protein
MTITINQGMLDTIIDDSDEGWDDNPITFSIGVDPGGIIQDVADFLGLTGFDPNVVDFNASDIPLMIEIAGLWDDVISYSINYVFNNDDKDIIINQVSNLPAAAAGTTFSTLHFPVIPDDADIYLLNMPIVAGTQTWRSAVHEFGHALGLQHPGDYNANETPTTYANDAEFPEDTGQFSLMSYFDPANFGAGWTPQNSWLRTEILTPMIYDILAVQAYYGVDTTTRTGDTTYGFNGNADRSVFHFQPNQKPVLTIWDAGGAFDRLDVSGFEQSPGVAFTGAQLIDLHEGSYSDVAGYQRNVGIAFGTWIEQAIGGAGNDTLIGNQFNNYLDGAGGVDTLRGELGDDTYLVDQAADNVVELFNEGNDTVNALSNTYTLSDNVERLVYVGNPNTGFTGNGNALGNEIRGSANGADTLDGRGGDDQMYGLGGNDLYIVDSYGDQTIEQPNAGNDTVRTALGNYTLQANVENLEFTGAGPLVTVGNELDNIITGNIGDDVIAGGGGNDTLKGNNGNDRLSGDAGDDSLYGGAGDDLLDGGDNNDFVSGGDGNDQVSGGSGDDTVDGGSGHDQVFGGDGADYLTGGAGNDDLSGEAGNDQIFGGDGNDLLSGGTGDDVLAGESGDDAIGGGDGADIITGGAGNDNLSGEAGVDNINGGDGNDIISGGAADDVLTGEAGDDTIGGGTGADDISGGAGNDNLSGEGDADKIAGGEGNDILNGGDGNDRLTGGSGNDTISGGDGDDYIVEGAGADNIEGGAGKDTVDYSSSTVGISFNANQVGTSGDALGDVLQNIEVLIGTALPDVLYGDAGDNTLQGGGGNDSLYSLTGQDLLDGGLGADAMAGGLGDDVYLVDNVGDVVTELSGEGRDRVETTLAAYGLTANVEDLTFVGTGDFTGIGNLLANVIIGGTANDTLRGGQGADTLNGGSGSDTADYSTSAVAVNVNLATGVATGGDAAGDTLISMENVTGSAFSDVLTGNAGDNVLKGGDGNDTINGGAGADWLDGGSGVNALTGGSGDDTYVVQANGTGTITELAGGGIDTVRTSQSTATLEANVENLIFIGTGNFRGTGNDLANQITGGDGADNIKGQGGNDILLGLAGADSLTGGDGNDRLDGGLGADILDDSSGNDTFVFHVGDGGQDNVRGFTAGAASGDVLEIHGTGWTTLADVLNHLGTGTNNNTTVIQLDATTSIMLKGVSALDLTNSDFLLV